MDGDPRKILRAKQIRAIQQAREDDLRAFTAFSRAFHGKHKGLVRRTRETEKRFADMLHNNARLRRVGKGGTRRRKNGSRRVV